MQSFIWNGNWNCRVRKKKEKLLWCTCISWLQLEWVILTRFPSALLTAPVAGTQITPSLYPLSSLLTHIIVLSLPAQLISTSLLFVEFDFQKWWSYCFMWQGYEQGDIIGLMRDSGILKPLCLGRLTDSAIWHITHREIQVIWWYLEN